MPLNFTRPLAALFAVLVVVAGWSQTLALPSAAADRTPAGVVLVA